MIDDSVFIEITELALGHLEKENKDRDFELQTAICLIENGCKAFRKREKELSDARR